MFEDVCLMCGRPVHDGRAYCSDECESTDAAATTSPSLSSPDSLFPPPFNHGHGPDADADDEHPHPHPRPSAHRSRPSFSSSSNSSTYLDTDDDDVLAYSAAHPLPAAEHPKYDPQGYILNTATHAPHPYADPDPTLLRIRDPQGFAPLDTRAHAPRRSGTVTALADVRPHSRASPRSSRSGTGASAGTSASTSRSSNQRQPRSPSSLSASASAGPSASGSTDAPGSPHTPVSKSRTILYARRPSATNTRSTIPALSALVAMAELPRHGRAGLGHKRGASSTSSSGSCAVVDEGGEEKEKDKERARWGRFERRRPPTATTSTAVAPVAHSAPMARTSQRFSYGGIPSTSTTTSEDDERDEGTYGRRHRERQRQQAMMTLKAAPAPASVSAETVTKSVPRTSGGAFGMQALLQHQQSQLQWNGGVAGSPTVVKAKRSRASLPAYFSLLTGAAAAASSSFSPSSPAATRAKVSPTKPSPTVSNHRDRDGAASPRSTRTPTAATAGAAHWLPNVGPSSSASPPTPRISARKPAAVAAAMSTATITNANANAATAKVAHVARAPLAPPPLERAAMTDSMILVKPTPSTVVTGISGLPALAADDDVFKPLNTRTVGLSGTASPFTPGRRGSGSSKRDASALRRERQARIIAAMRAFEAEPSAAVAPVARAGAAPERSRSVSGVVRRKVVVVPERSRSSGGGRLRGGVGAAVGGGGGGVLPLTKVDSEKERQVFAARGRPTERRRGSALSRSRSPSPRLGLPGLPHAAGEAMEQPQRRRSLSSSPLRLAVEEASASGHGCARRRRHVRVQREREREMSTSPHSLSPSPSPSRARSRTRTRSRRPRSPSPRRHRSTHHRRSFSPSSPSPSPLSPRHTSPLHRRSSSPSPTHPHASSQAPPPHEHLYTYAERRGRLTLDELDVPALEDFEAGLADAPGYGNGRSGIRGRSRVVAVGAAAAVAGSGGEVW